MPEAEGRSFSFEGYDAIDRDVLEAIEYEGSPQNVLYETDEFSAVCPFSGLPDIATVRVQYVPSGKIVELKSLKYYFTSYRNVGIYQEAATDRIYHDLYELLAPRYLSVETVYNIRGGIKATCLIDSELIEEYQESHHESS